MENYKLAQRKWEADKMPSVIALKKKKLLWESHFGKPFQRNGKGTKNDTFLLSALQLNCLLFHSVQFGLFVCVFLRQSLFVSNMKQQPRKNDKRMSINRILHL